MYVTLTSPDALAVAMNRKGVSVRQLAKLTGLKPAMLGHLRTGRNQTTTIQNAVLLADALNVEARSLWGVRDAHLLGPVHGGSRE